MSFANLGLSQAPDGGLQITSGGNTGTILDTVISPPGMVTIVNDGSHAIANFTAPIGSWGVASFVADGRSNYFHLVGSITYTTTYASAPTLTFYLGTSTGVAATSFAVQSTTYVVSGSGSAHTIALDLVGVSATPLTNVYLNATTTQGVALVTGSWTGNTILTGQCFEVVV